MKHLLGIDIGGTKTAVIYALETENGLKIMERTAFATLGVKETLRKIVACLYKTIGKHGLTTAAIYGIGISCGGPLDSKKGVIMSPPNLPGWDNIPIVELLQKEFDVPCAIQNDANACALAEWKYGAGMGTQNMVFLTFGTGLGAGLVLNGQLYSGTNNNAGEIGHIRLSSFGPVGYGKQGSFEGFASGGGIAQLAKAKLTEQFQRGRKVAWCDKENIDNVTAKMVAEEASKGDAVALDIIETSASYLGKGLAVVVDMLNPERIVIGSIYARNVELFYPIMKKALEQEALDVALQVCEVCPAQLGDKIGDYAAISIAGTINKA